MVLTNQLIYLVNVKTMRKIFFSNYVCFSKSPNFKMWFPIFPIPITCSLVVPDEQNQAHFTVNKTTFEHKEYLII